MKDRAMKAAKQYFLRMHDDADYLGEQEGFLVFNTDEGVVFINTTWSDEEFKASNTEILRHDFEMAMELWFTDHNEMVNIPVRCDEIALHIIGEEHALLRHHVNVVGECCENI